MKVPDTQSFHTKKRASHVEKSRDVHGNILPIIASRLKEQ